MHSVLGSDRLLDFEDSDEDEIEIDVDSKTDLACPFCLGDFDIVELYCHLDDQHPMEANSGVCPLCSLRVGMNLIGHVISKHGDFFKLHRKLKLLKRESWSTSSLLRRDSLGGHMEHFLRRDSQRHSSSSMRADPLLSSFVCNPPSADEPKSAELRPKREPSLVEESSDSGISERCVPPSSSSEEQALLRLAVEEQGEKAQRCKFIQGLLWSTIIDDDL